MVTALDATDLRSFGVAVGGPAALLIAKLHKVSERVSERGQRRLDDKDALDVLRLLQATRTGSLAGTFVRLLGTELTCDVTREALTAIKDLFGDPRAAGSQMAVRAVGALAPADEIAGSCAALATDLLRAVDAEQRR